jgi:ATP-dependent DNA helicase RecQ
MLWTDKAVKILKKYFDFSDLKEKQIDVINELLLGNDVIGLLPTGYGKSMCYILPPLLTKKTIFIISPLISLMDDQKDKLQKLGIPVCALHCNNLNKQNEINKIIDGNIKIVYMSPEYLIEGDGFELATQLINNNQLGFLAIDESHCLSSWGHDFRPQYLKLQKFRELFPQIPILAVTATAKNQVVKEIIAFLKLTKPKIVKANFDRPNLYLKCIEIPKDQIVTGKRVIKIKEIPIKNDIIIREYVEKYPNDRIIVYVNSRDNTEEISKDLNKWKKCSSPYHAGLNKNIREQIQSDFIEGNIKVIVSTIAFGMGIDQIVRCVLIFGCPSSIEEYYQQIGRGGRDGLQSETVLYFDKGAYMKSKRMISFKSRNKDIENKKLDNLHKVYNFFDTKICRRHFILEYFGIADNYFLYTGFTCSNCDNCCNKNLIDFTKEYYNHYINNKKLSNELKSYIDKFKINNLLNDWKLFIQFKKYELIDIPIHLQIKLPINIDTDIEKTDSPKVDSENIYDTCTKIYDNLQIK